MMYSKGVSWIDDCRISSNEVLGREQKSSTSYAMLQGGYNDGFWDNTKGLGRFPANILVSDDMLNDGVISKSSVYDNNKGDTNGFHATSRDIIGKRKDIGGFNDKGTNSRYYNIDKWFENLIK